MVESSNSSSEKSTNSYKSTPAVTSSQPSYGGISRRSEHEFGRSNRSLSDSEPLGDETDNASSRRAQLRRAASSRPGVNTLQRQNSNSILRRKSKNYNVNADRSSTYTPPQMRVVRQISDVYHNSSSSDESSEGSHLDEESNSFEQEERASASRRSRNSNGRPSTNGVRSGSYATPSTEDTSHLIPGRLTERDQAFQQSTGLLKIEQHADRESWAQILALYTWDWFHVLLIQPTSSLICFLTIIYSVWVLIFAGLYLSVNDVKFPACNLAGSDDELDFGAAFAFSLSTAATIGYGLIDDSMSYFHSCPQVPLIVYIQCIVTLSLNAFLVGIVYQRIGRADSRSHQVIFSDKACIRCVHGQFYFSFQVYDLDRNNPIVEAHVRCYAVSTESDGLSKANFQTRFMRLQNPNDDLGSVLFLSLPSNVVHAIDNWSPLMPPELEREHWDFVHDHFVHSAANRYVFPGIVLRDNDPRDGSRESVSCPICGDSFQTDEHLLRHIRFTKCDEEYIGSSGDESSEGLTRTISNPRLEALRGDHRERTSDSIITDIDSHSVSSKNFRERHHHQYHKHHHKEGEVRISHHFSNIPELINYAQPEYSSGHQNISTDVLLTRDKVIPNTDYIPDMSEESEKSSETKEESQKRSGENSRYNKNPDSRARIKTARYVREEIREHMFNSHMEIMVIVEGIEPNSSHTFQARNSYAFENIEFDHWFAPCVNVRKDGRAQVNLNRFHELVPVPDYVDEAEPVQSML